MKTKYSEIGIILGNLADWMRENQHDHTSDVFHMAFRKVLSALEEQAEEIEKLTRKVAVIESRKP